MIVKIAATVAALAMMVDPSNASGTCVVSQFYHDKDDNQYAKVPYQYDSPRNFFSTTTAVRTSQAGKNTACQVNDGACSSQWDNAFVPSFSVHNVHRARATIYNSGRHPHWATNSGYYAPMSVWGYHGVAVKNQKRLAFTILNKPAKADIEYIAMFFNGQENCTGWPQSTTGSNEGWRKRLENVDENWKYGAITYDKKSAAQLFVNGHGSPQAYGEDLRVFQTSKSLVIAAPDAGFSYPGTLTAQVATAASALFGTCNPGNTQAQNLGVLRGWNDWLMNNVNPSKIKGIYLYGMSRGGCFATRFADHLFRVGFLQSFKTSVKLLLSTNDPVCHPHEWPSSVQTDMNCTNNWGRANNRAIKSPYSWRWCDATGKPEFDHNCDPYCIKKREGNCPDTTRSRCNGIKVANLFPGVPRQNIRWLNYIGGQDIIESEGLVFGESFYTFCDESTATVNAISNSISNPPEARYSNLQIKIDGTVIRTGSVQHGGLVYTGTSSGSSNGSSNDDIVPGGHPAAEGTSPSGGYFRVPTQAEAVALGTPLPHNCDVWYNQVWVPWSHGAQGGVYQPLQTLSSNPAVNRQGHCPGMASCGSGLNPALPLNLLNPNHETPILQNCAVNPAPTMDFVYKLTKHASTWASRWFAIPGRSLKRDCPVVTIGASRSLGSLADAPALMADTDAPVEDAPALMDDIDAPVKDAPVLMDDTVDDVAPADSEIVG